MSYLFKKLEYIKNNFLIETITVLIMSIILVNTLLITPIVGKCDNGDFGRLYMYGGLSGLSNEYSKMYDGYVHLKYAISNAGILIPFGPNWISGTLLLKAAVVMSILIPGKFGGLFDIRYLALVYSIVFLTAIFIIIEKVKLPPFLKISACVLIILFFTDTAYISYFNSFFGEAGVIVYFFMNLSSYILLISKNKPSKRYFVLFFLSSGAFLTSKSQELPLLIFMLFIYAGLYFSYREKELRKTIIFGAISVIILCSCSYCSISLYTNYNNIYQSVFSGVLLDSKTKEKDLEELGVSKDFKCFYRVSFYNRTGKNDPMGSKMLKEFYPNISSIKILSFYLKHLDRLWLRIQISAKNAYTFNKLHKDNFLKGQYNKNKLVNNFRLSLINKFPFLHRNIYVFIVFSIFYLIINIIYFIKYKDRYIRLLNLMLLFILAAGTAQFILPVIGSGECDFGKHLFLVNLSFDTMFVIALLWILDIIKKSCCLLIMKLSTLNNNLYKLENTDSKAV